MEEKQLINLIKKLKSVQPDENWVILNRSRLAFRLEMEHKKDLLNRDFSVLGELFSFWKTDRSASFGLAKGVLAGFLILSGFGGATVWAAKQSLPGAPLYRVKIALEKAQMTASFSQQDKMNFQAEMAENRLSELKELMQTSDSISQKREKAAEVMENMKAQLSDANSRLSKNQSVKATEMVKTVSKVEKTVSQVKGVLTEEVRGDLNKQLIALADVADKAGIQALEMILKFPDEAQAEKDEILAKVDEKISNAENAIKEISQKTVPAIDSAIAESDSGKNNSAIVESRIAEMPNIRAVLVKNQSDRAQELLNQAKTALSGAKGKIAENKTQEALNDLSGVLETINLAKTMIKSAQTIADGTEADSGLNIEEKRLEMESENASSTKAR